MFFCIKKLLSDTRFVVTVSLANLFYLSKLRMQNTNYTTECALNS